MNNSRQSVLRSYLSLVVALIEVKFPFNWDYVLRTHKFYLSSVFFFLVFILVEEGVRWLKSFYQNGRSNMYHVLGEN